MVTKCVIYIHCIEASSKMARQFREDILDHFSEDLKPHITVGIMEQGQPLKHSDGSFRTIHLEIMVVDPEIEGKVRQGLLDTIAGSTFEIWHTRVEIVDARDSSVLTQKAKERYADLIRHINSIR